MANIVTMGEMLLRLSTRNCNTFGQSSDFQANYGGGEANVAISLAHMGHSVKYATKLPDNPIGDCAVNELYKMHVSTENIVRGGERIGTYYLETGSSVRPSKVVYDRKHSSISEAEPSEFDFDMIFDGADWFHFSGITAGISEKGALLTRAFAKEALKRNLKISVDINYRGRLWTMEEASKVMPELVEMADVAFAGPIDSIKILGCTKTAGDDWDKAMSDTAVGECVLKEMAYKYNLSYVINSQRESISATHNIIGARILDRKSGDVYYSSKYDVDSIVDRVGGGDALAAGVISALANDYNDYRMAIEFGSAASAIKHTINGDYNMASKESVMDLIKSGGSGIIRR